MPAPKLNARFARRRRFIALGTTGAIAVIFGRNLLGVSGRGRARFAAGMVLDFLYSRFGPRPEVRTVPDHPMQYMASFAHDENSAAARESPASAILMTIDGSDRDFRWNHSAFVRARHGCPFIIVTPFVVSNGGHADPADYPYSPAVFRAAVADPLAFDVAGVAAVLRDVNARCAAIGTDRPLPVYLTGFSAGGHLTWLLTLTHPEWFAGVAPASANFVGRGIAGVSTDPAAHRLAIHGFQGDADRRAGALNAQWNAASALAFRNGFRNVTRTVVPGAGHSPFAAEVVAKFGDLLENRNRARPRG